MAGSVTATDIVHDMTSDPSAVRGAVNQLGRALDDLLTALDHLNESRGRGPAPTLLTITEAAFRLGVGRTTLYRMLDAGQLTPVPCGQSQRVRSTDVDQLLGKAA